MAEMDWGPIIDFLAVIGGVYSILAILYAGIQRIFFQKLSVKIEEACWLHSTVSGPRGPDVEWTLQTKIRFLNKLGKDTTISEIRVEREGEEPLKKPLNLNISNNNSDVDDHKWWLGTCKGKIDGKTIVVHLHGDLEVPIRYEYKGEEDDCPIIIV